MPAPTTTTSFRMTLMMARAAALAPGGTLDSMQPIPRTNWPGVTKSFVAFFAGLGTVDTDQQKLSFTAPGEDTGLSLGRDGTSSSFMPLHGLSARWDTVTFDQKQRTVVLEGSGFTYTYRAPPGLVRP